MTYTEAVHRALSCLEQHHVPDADIDALLLLQFVCGITRAQYYACADQPMSGADLERYREIIGLRAKRIPLQQLTGEQFFMGLPMRVSEDVLIPRQDTELLAQEALRRARPGDRVLDLCTGSGCVLISLLKLGRNLTGRGTDLSGKALSLARENAERNGVDALFEQCDLFGQTQETYDLIVSNPPYIPSGMIGSLMEEVREHEPLSALDGGADGLDLYRRIVPQSPAYLREGGWLLVEIGCDQADAVRSMFVDSRYEEISVLRDLGGNDRVVLGRKAIV